MFRLRNHFRLSTRMRDRLGMLSAMGAVACLGSLIVHSSQPYPVQRSNWEQEFFSDLAHFDPPADQAKAAGDEPALPTTPAPIDLTVAGTGSSPETDAVSTDRSSGTREVPHPFNSLLAKPIDQRPVADRPRFILPVKHEELSAADSVWLSGDIEITDDQPTSPAAGDSGRRQATSADEPPVTLFFLPLDSD